jgi:Ni,Fe-hydrogenase I large subunit
LNAIAQEATEIMPVTKKIIPLNRVEGDLEIQLEIEDDVVRDARSIGTMYRGIENLMTGRGPMDSLVITPRICGICTTAHLNAAAKALDMAYGAQVPDNAQRLRNVTLLVEQLQNDIRHAVFLFMPDLTHPRYADQPLYAEAMHRYQVLKGETTRQAVEETQKLIEIIAILGGQWPHSSFMVPGGVVSVPTVSDIVHCRHILRNFRKWYERRILGCPLDLWDPIDSWQGLQAWLVQAPHHYNSEVGFFIRYGQDLKLETLGRGHDAFLSFGGPDAPPAIQREPRGEPYRAAEAGIYSADGLAAMDPALIAEDITSSFFKDDAASRHPYEGRTVVDDADPQSTGDGAPPTGQKYSWAKAPRYNGRPAECGPLADMLAAGRPLFVERVRARGGNVLLRQLARLARPAAILPAIDQWLADMTVCKSPFFQDYSKRVTSRGHGLVSAPRGALGHWLTIQDGVVANYQVITPTAWNASPRDAQGVRGPWEEAMVGTVVRDIRHPLEVEHIVRSFDPCLVCTVHAMKIR